MAAALRKPNLSPELLQALSSAVAGGEARTLAVGVSTFDEVLPDAGLPRGAVVELSAPTSLGQTTSLALRLCASAQAEACLRGGAPAWCCWLDPSCTLYAPGVAAHGVHLDRLLVVRPPLEALARMAVRVVTSRVFSVVVIDTVGVIGAEVHTPLHRWDHGVRRLAIAAQGGDSCVLLLTDTRRSREALLPVALRLEVVQRSDQRLAVRVAKERRGRIGGFMELAYARPATAPLQQAG